MLPFEEQFSSRQFIEELTGDNWCSVHMRLDSLVSQPNVIQTQSAHLGVVLRHLMRWLKQNRYIYYYQSALL